MKQVVNGKVENQAAGKVAHKFKTVWSIQKYDNMQRPVWTRIGTAWVNRDNSLNVILDAAPKDFKLHIRDSEPRKTA